MEPETTSTTSEPVSETSEPVSEPATETTTTETTTTETTVVDDSQTELLQSINDTQYWSIAFQVVIICLLLFQVFFTALKAGKN